MKRWSVSVLLVLLAVTLSYAQSATPQTAAPNPTASAAPAPESTSNPDIKGSFPTRLMKGLDSKKLKVGDIVVCQTMAALHSRSGLLIPSGSKVFGHITQAQSKSNGGSDSTLAMVFDKIEYAKGKELPMKGVLQAVGPSLGDNEPSTGPAGSMTLGGRGGGAATTPPADNNAVAGPNAGMHPLESGGPRSLLNAESKGVLGIKNLQMDANGVLTSTGKEVKLENNTQMMIHAEISTPVQ
jgi:hypothetical protein